MSVPKPYKTLAFWISVAVAALGAVVILPDNPAWWRVLASIGMAVLPILSLKSLHNDTSSRVDALQGTPKDAPEHPS